MSLASLRGALASGGLDLFAPLSAAAFDALAPPVWRTADVCPTAASVVVIGSGGRAFFERATAAPEWRDGNADPLDAYTRRTVHEALSVAGLAPAVVALYCDARDGAFMPMIALAEAASLGCTGRIGLLIHPEYGPWVSLRAVAYLAVEAHVEASSATVTAPCPPADAERTTGEPRRADASGTPLVLPACAAPPSDAAQASPGYTEVCDTEVRRRDEASPARRSASPCTGCPAPCERACHGRAVSEAGLDLVQCGATRLSHEACRLRCDARSACVVGTEHRYADAQLTYHTSFSLDTVMRHVVKIAGETARSAR
jgi:hypothetical protein